MIAQTFPRETLFAVTSYLQSECDMRHDYEIPCICIRIRRDTSMYILYISRIAGAGDILSLTIFYSQLTCPFYFSNKALWSSERHCRLSLKLSIKHVPTMTMNEVCNRSRKATQSIYIYTAPFKEDVSLICLVKWGCKFIDDLIWRHLRLTNDPRYKLSIHFSCNN